MMQNKSRRGRSAATLVALVLSLALVVTGCGGDNSRLAAEAEVEAGSNPGSNESERVGALFKGVRVCVRNETGRPIPTINVSYTTESGNVGPSSADNGYLNAAGDEQQRCAVADTVKLGANTVTGIIRFGKTGAADYNFEAFNELFYPRAILRSSFAPTAYQNNCVDSGFSEGEAHTYDDGVYAITLSRQKDGALKEFLITIKPTSNPSSDNRSRAC